MASIGKFDHPVKKTTFDLVIVIVIHYIGKSLFCDQGFLRRLFRQSISARLILSATGQVALVIGVAMLVIGLQVHRSMEARMRQDLQQTVALVASMLDGFGSQLEQTARQLGSSWLLALPGPLVVESRVADSVSATDEPLVRAGSQVLNQDVEWVDRFSSATGAVATILVRRQDDLIRVSTSVKGKDGQRELGTSLDRHSPAYQRLMQGKPYTGRVMLFGRHYMADYRPILDGTGQLVGATFVGLDFTSSFQTFKQQVLQIKIGETGYVYAFEASSGADQGRLTIHPVKEGVSILDTRDINGFAFTREMLAHKQGMVSYWWANGERGESQAREKVAAYQHQPRWNWVVGAGSYRDEFERDLRPLMLTIGAAGVIGVGVLALVLAWVIRSGVTRPLQQVIASLRTMSGGDYRQAIRVNRQDELGQVQQALADMRQQMCSVVGQIASGAQRVTAASTQLSTSAADVAHGSQQQNAAAGSMAAAMEQLSVSIDQVSENAREAHHLSGESGELSAEGARLIQRTAATIRRVEADVTALANNVLHLGRRADAISSIVSTIKEIADQTNLLALNASIESARAGEQGRGFAVVADEVRKLAERTAVSTQEIAEVIRQIQSGTREVTAEITASVDKVSEGAQLAADAEAAMARIRSGADRVGLVVNDISAALAEQTTAGADIARNVEQIAGMAENNERAVSQVAHAASDLQQLAGELARSVDQIRL